jgi:hypothetical protein
VRLNSTNETRIPTGEDEILGESQQTILLVRDIKQSITLRMLNLSAQSDTLCSLFDEYHYSEGC